MFDASTSSVRGTKDPLPSSAGVSSKVSVAYPVRPSSEMVPDAKGSATATTWSAPATSARTASTACCWSCNVSPSSTAKTTRAEACVASGNLSSSSRRARSLWLPFALKASMKPPPPLPARANTAPRTTTQVAMVRQGCLALAMAMPRVNLSMVVPFGDGWMSRTAKVGSDVVSRHHHTW